MVKRKSEFFSKHSCSHFHQWQEKARPKKSLRILTAVIEGTKHWSQFKDKVPMMFEIFGESSTIFSRISRAIWHDKLLVWLPLSFCQFCSSHSRFCSYNRKIWCQELPNEGWEGYSAMCLLRKREYDFFMYVLNPAEYLEPLSYSHPYHVSCAGRD